MEHSSRAQRTTPRRRKSVVLWGLALLIAGCKPHEAKPNQATSPNPAQTFIVANGTFGARLGPLGLSDHPAHASMSLGGYQRSGEEKLVPGPGVAPFKMSIDGATAVLDGAPTLIGTPSLRKIEIAVPVVAGGAKHQLQWSAEIDDSKLSLSYSIKDPGILELQPLGATSAEKRASDGSVSVFVPLPGPAPGHRSSDTPQFSIEGAPADANIINQLIADLNQGIGPIPSPFGMTNSRYNGHVFWDADVWMVPALVWINPDKAKLVAQYRLARLDAAARHAEVILGGPSTGALAFPWESSVTGSEVAPGESRKQHHISGSVAWGMAQMANWGVISPEEARKVGIGVAKFYATRASRRSDGAWTVKDTMSPDEFFTGDDDLYTNVIAEWVIRTYGSDSQVRFYRARDKDSFLNYTGDKVTGYKQTAGLLAAYPLQDALVEPESGKMLDRFAEKVTKNGPAMSDSIHAIIAARNGRANEAYELWQRGLHDFLVKPQNTFSEKRSKPTDYFFTGNAGCLQTVFYGLLGMRVDRTAQQGALWSMPLRNGQIISCKPALPRGWQRVTCKGLNIGGKRIDLLIERGKVTVLSAG